jgi:hypothetical protein
MDYADRKWFKLDTNVGYGSILLKALQRVVNSVNVGYGPLLVMLIQPLKYGDLAIEMVLSGIVIEHGERAGATEGILLSHTPCV